MSTDSHGPKGFLQKYVFSQDHKVIGIQFLFLSLFMLFFGGLLEKPNLELSDGVNTLGHYNYGADTLCITKHLLQRPDLLDYVMYHEMLHKHHKFSTTNGRSRHHTKAFRDDERKFPNADELEKELSRFVTKTTRRRWFGLA